MGITIIATIAVFLIVLMLLVSLLLFAKAKLTPSGAVKININGEKTIEVEAGSTLLSTLGNNKVFLPSACGGGGTCTPYNGGNGGSGIVVVRLPSEACVSVSPGANTVTSCVGPANDKVATFTVTGTLTVS